MTEPTFIIRNNPKFVNYVKSAWRFFLYNQIDGCHITIRKNDVFIHITRLYCVIFNDLRHIQANPELYTLEMNRQAKELLKRYD